MLTSVSFFCPAYRDEGNLPILIPRADAFLRRIASAYEIIIVHDGSPDRTGDIADGLARRYPSVRVIHHPANEGYGATLRDGFAAARYDYVMYTDGDCQYDIEEFEPYLSLLDRADVISGYARHKALSRMRKIQSLVFNSLISLLFGIRLRDINCSMKIYKRAVLDAISPLSRSAFIDAEMLIRAHRAGFSIAQFPVTHLPRHTGLASGSRPSVIFTTIRDMVRFRFALL